MSKHFRTVTLLSLQVHACRNTHDTHGTRYTLTHTHNTRAQGCTDMHIMPSLCPTPTIVPHANAYECA